MFKTAFFIEFFGGSSDGTVAEATEAPCYYVVAVGQNVYEVYERQNNNPPFVYSQIGYAEDAK